LHRSSRPPQTRCAECAWHRGEKFLSRDQTAQLWPLAGYRHPHFPLRQTLPDFSAMATECRAESSFRRPGKVLLAGHKFPLRKASAGTVTPSGDQHFATGQQRGRGA